MKKLIILFLFLTVKTWAQVPQQINYQGVARDLTGNAIKGQAITLDFLIYNQSIGGIVLYSETVNKTTDIISGTFSHGIGGGIPTFSVFANIDWSTGQKFLEVKYNGTVLGRQQMLSVPFALYAEKSGSSISQSLTINGNSLSISGGNTISLPVSTVAPVPNTSVTGSGIASITAIGTNSFDIFVPAVNISGAGNTTVSGSFPNYTVSSLAGNNPNIIGVGATSVASAGNSFTVATPQVNISGPGVLGSFPNYTVLSAPPSTLTAGNSNISITGAAPNYTISSSPTLAISGNSLSISNGNAVVLPGAPATTITGLGTNTVTGSAPNFTINTLTSGVVPGSYGSPNFVPFFTVDIYGRLTGAGSYSISIPTNSLNGDVSGTFLSNTVTALRGFPLAAVSPTIGQILAYTGSVWTPTTPPIVPLASWVKSGTTVTLATNTDFVGIGVAVPVAKLEIINPVGNANDAVRIIDGGSGVALRATNTHTSTTVYAGIFDGGLITKGKNSLASDFAFLAKDVANTNIFTIKNNGFTTIGASGGFPSANLNIEGSDNTTNFYPFAASPSSALKISNFDLTNNNFSSLAFAGSGVESAKIVGVHVNHTAGSFRGDLAFMTRDPGNINEVMRITSFGNVGIGLLAPSVKLHVNNTSGQVGLQVDGADPSYSSIYVNALTANSSPGYGYLQSGILKGGHWINGAGEWHLDVNGSARQTVLPNGNVGIGTTAPTATLHVNGNVKIVDGTQAAGKILTSDAFGTASWQNPAPKIAFNAGSNAVSNQNVPAAILTTVQFGAGNNFFNDGGGYSLGTNQFTPPSPGVYCLSTYISIQGSVGANLQVWISGPGPWFARSVGSIPGSAGTTIVHLTATVNTAITPGPWTVQVYSSAALTIFPYDSGFSGFKVY